MPVGGIGLAEADRWGKSSLPQTHGTREPSRTQSEGMVEAKALGPLPPTRHKLQTPGLSATKATRTRSRGRTSTVSPHSPWRPTRTWGPTGHPSVRRTGKAG